MSDNDTTDTERGYAENIGHQVASTVVKTLVVTIADNPVAGVAELAGGVVKSVGSLFGLFRSDD